MPKVRFFKNHKSGCPKRRLLQSTACDCPWQFSLPDGRVIDLSGWLGGEASSIRLRSGTCSNGGKG